MSTTSLSPPKRFLRTPAAYARFGDRVDRIAPFFEQLDPLADAVVEALADPEHAGQARHLIDRALDGSLPREQQPPALAALVDAVTPVPVWVDWDAIDRGGRVLVRTSILGGVVLATRSLIYGYSAPGGNKPLVMSGRLREQAARRLNETSRFVQAVVRPGGLRRQGDGFAITLKVRLMHAQVRRMLLQSGRWQAREWGAPINQHDMAATILLFSLVVLDGLRALGVRISAEDSDDYMHLWRYVGHLIGVTPDLQPANEREARALAELIQSTQAPPDDDSRSLTRALLEAGPESTRPLPPALAQTRRDVIEGVCRGLLGEDLADALAVRRTAWRYAVPTVRPLIALLDEARRRVPQIDATFLSLGERYWDAVVRIGLAGASADFAMPASLLGLRAVPAPRVSPA